MSPRFSHVFQFGQRWLNWLNRQPPDSVRTVVMETMVKIIACGTSLMGWSIWRCPDPQCNSEKRINLPAKVEAAHIVASKLAYNGLTIH